MNQPTYGASTILFGDIQLRILVLSAMEKRPGSERPEETMSAVSEVQTLLVLVREHTDTYGGGTIKPALEDHSFWLSH